MGSCLSRREALELIMKFLMAMKNVREQVQRYRGMHYVIILNENFEGVIKAIYKALNKFNQFVHRRD